MAVFKVETKNKVDIDKKPRVYFTCHPDDFGKYFKKICDDIFKTHDCAIYYTEDMTEIILEEERETNLGRNNLFVVPVTFKLLSTPNRAIDEDIPYALKEHIPVLPIIMELVDDELYSSKFGELQYLNPLSEDQTEIPYEEKLKKYLESVLISKELADRIRHAFYAYIFLSYRKVDRAYANTLMRLIHSIPDCRDFAIWFDEFLTPGESFKANIEKALDDCKLFTLLVTERLFKKNVDEHGNETDNFVIANELPMAKDKRAEKGTEIFAVEMEGVDEDAPSRLGADEYIRYDDAEFRDRLMAAISKIKYDVVDTSEHTFLMGLAYLEGIDMEVDRERAVKLIESAAEVDLAEAMEKLICMYKDGVGVARDAEEVQKWSKRLAEHYFKRIFSKRRTIKSKKKLLELFSHYADDYFTETIKEFLICADKRLTEKVIVELYEFLMQQEICEYTLFFEACKNMSQYQEKTQIILVTDILTKSVEGTYPPYGPLFWYIPEYKLYEVSLLTLDSLKNSADFAKMLALVRDVCWIFGHKNTVNEITDRVDGESLFTGVELLGARKELCELFFCGSTDLCTSDDVYPRCFNIKEAKSWKENGCGVLGCMTSSFEDDLGLFSHDMHSELNNEFIGIVAALYDMNQLESILLSKSSQKLRGLFLSAIDDETEMRPLAINNRNIDVIYIPENVFLFRLEYALEQHSLSKPPHTETNVAAFFGRQKIYFHKSVCIPNDITSLENFVFLDQSSLVTITLPDSLEQIERGAFKGCTSLSSIIIPPGVGHLGHRAFENCISLSTIALPDGITTIARGVFEGCQSLCAITLPTNLTRIEPNAFYNCTSLSSVVLPAGITYIGDSAFNNCSSLLSIVIPDSITDIHSATFKGCTSLSSIVIPDSVTKIEDYAFSGCTSLSSITIPDSITNITGSAFRNCASLSSIVIPDSVTKIENYAFSGCTSLLSITIPDSVTKIGRYAFSGCTSLSSVVLPAGIKRIEENAFENCTYLSSIVIPDSVTKIENYAFSGCTSLSSITIPDSVTEIGRYAFSGCASLSSFTLPDSIKSIGEGVFDGCHQMKTIDRCPMKYIKKELGVSEDCVINYKTEHFQTLSICDGITEIVPNQFAGRSDITNIFIPDSVIKIGDSAFKNCTSLSSIIIPDSVTEIGSQAFSGCTSLSSVVLPTGITYIGDGAFNNCSSLLSIVIPDSITKIRRDTFNDCKSLSSIVIPANVTEIDSCAFSGCASLSSIAFSKEIKEIGNHAFSHCYSLSSVVLPDGIETIHRCAFLCCDSLTSIKLPNSIRAIHSGAFSHCKSLAEITLPNSITTISDCLFDGCASLKTIVIPMSVRTIETYAFYGCKTLASVTLPDGIIRIEEMAFCACDSLSSIILPYSIQKIGDRTFTRCVKLASVSLPENLVQMGENVFEGCCNLRSVSVPPSIRVLNDHALAGCTGLQEITISRRFEGDIQRIFGDIDPNIITFI